MENWIGPILFGPVLGLVLALGLVCANLWINLRRQNLVLESFEARISANEKKLKKEQDEQQQQRKLALSLIENNGFVKVFNEELEKSKKEFELMLNKARVEAEEKIDFSVVKYKNFITKERKSASRKADKLKPPHRQIWRSIDED